MKRLFLRQNPGFLWAFMAKIIAHFMIYTDIMLNNKALHLHTISAVFAHKYFKFQKMPVLERQQKSV